MAILKTNLKLHLESSSELWLLYSIQPSVYSGSNLSAFWHKFRHLVGSEKYTSVRRKIRVTWWWLSWGNQSGEIYCCLKMVITAKKKKGREREISGKERSKPKKSTEEWKKILLMIFLLCYFYLNITCSFHNAFYINLLICFIQTVFMSCQCSLYNFLAAILKTIWVWFILWEF